MYNINRKLAVASLGRVVVKDDELLELLTKKRLELSKRLVPIDRVEIAREDDEERAQRQVMEDLRRKDLQQVAHDLLMVDNAIARVKAGIGGVCLMSACGDRIHDARLRAKPEARTCLSCAEGATARVGLSRVKARTSPTRSRTSRAIHT